MKQLKKKMLILTPLLAAVLVGCSKTEEQPSPATPTTQKKPTTTATSTPTTQKKPGSVSSSTAGSVVSMTPVTHTGSTAVPPTIDKAKQVANLETQYISTQDFALRVDSIYKMSNIETPEAMAALGRIFVAEKDPDLKVEVVSALTDFDGLDDQKIAILTAAVAADQHKDVREEAIDGLTDIDPNKAIPIVQALLNDADPDIREAAKDALEQLKDAQKNP